jgi:iron complex outermembrane receptor protein
VLNLGALWTVRKFSINLQEEVYGKSSEWGGDDGDNPTGEVEYFNTTIGVTPITNVDVSYRVLRHFTLSVGALNLFDRYPNKYNATLLAHYNNFAYGDVQGVFQYPMFSPFGIDGGYYYVRGTVSW